MPATPDVPLQWLSLGSYAPDSPCQLLVTLSNRGAAIERVELVERTAAGQLRFRDLDNGGGYTGLQCQDAPQGCRVTVVGPGTPAALAVPGDAAVAGGLAPGDVVVQCQGGVVRTRDELESRIAELRPGQSLDLRVRRGDGADARTLAFVLTLGVRPLALLQAESTDQDDPVSSYLLGLHRRQGESLMLPLGQALGRAAAVIAECPQCHNLDTVSPCSICASSMVSGTRMRSTL